MKKKKRLNKIIKYYWCRLHRKTGRPRWKKFLFQFILFIYLYLLLFLRRIWINRNKFVKFLTFVLSRKENFFFFFITYQSSDRIRFMVFVVLINAIFEDRRRPRTRIHAQMSIKDACVFFCRGSGRGRGVRVESNNSIRDIEDKGLVIR